MPISDLSPENSIENRDATSIFGDYLSQSFEPISQISGTYGESDKTESFSATGGSVSALDGQFVCNTGTSVGGYGLIRTSRSTVFREGQGLTARISAVFDGNAVANSQQGAGFVNLTDLIIFGYDGADFSILYETYGKPEIRQLSITASGNGNLTLTLDGTAYVIPITTGTIAHNAYEIEVWMKANQTIWNTQQIGDTLVFQARDTSSRNGTYSLSGTTFAGTFSQVEAGQAKDNTANVTQANWDRDPTWFDPTVINYYMIKMTYLGGSEFFISNPDTGKFELVHTIRPLGTDTRPSVSQRAFKVGWFASSLGSTTDLTVEGASASTFIDGESRLFSRGRSVENTNAAVGSTYEAVLTIRAVEAIRNRVNLGRLVPQFISIATDSGKPVNWIVVKDATLGETNYTYYDEGESVCTYDTGNHPYSDIRGIFSSVMSAGGSQLVDLRVLDIELYLNESLTVFARKTSGTDPAVTATISWKEDL